ncbi:39S ribosomal protein L10, mitochondrial [Eumeta japonica]|uniref:Large ribosomal subunit protein uL10m n=1 Tax=Eumeta variegata TaxID=151549 RepID=A0A4C2A7J4_EUMVA|nr:39S ribosomal protein L10, mitochondrial [Eumeta japonica]
MVVFLHLNPIKQRDKLPLFAEFTRNDMHLRQYGKKIVQMATSGTRFEPVNHLFTSQQEILFGQPEKVQKMFKILRKAPELVVMEGIIEDKLLSKNDLVEFSKLPDLQIARSQICTVLHSAATVLVSQLNQAQQSLVSHLDRHAEVENKANNEQENPET